MCDDANTRLLGGYLGTRENACVCVPICSQVNVTERQFWLGLLKAVLCMSSMHTLMRARYLMRLLLLLFPEPLSAVDAHVAKWLYDKVLGKEGMLK